MQNIIALQLEPAQFVYQYLRGDNGRSIPAYKDILFGFNDTAMSGWSASCGPADAPARYAIALSCVTFLQHFLHLIDCCQFPVFLQVRRATNCQFLNRSNLY